MLLDWTSEADIADVKAASPAAGGFELVLGADVCYGQQALPALFSCAAALLARTPSAAFLLGTGVPMGCIACQCCTAGGCPSSP